MQPAVPDEPRGASGPDAAQDASFIDGSGFSAAADGSDISAAADDPGFSAAADVGGFEQGTPFSRWALARYLVGRAIMSSVSQSLIVVAVVVLALAAGSYWGLHVTSLAVVLVIFALVVLFVRWVLTSLMRRFSDATSYSPVAGRLQSLVSDTHGDVLRELRRLGLPSHVLTLPLLAFRLIGRRRADTITRLRQFETARVVPAARVDELHMLLRNGGSDFGTVRR